MKRTRACSRRRGPTTTHRGSSDRGSSSGPERTLKKAAEAQKALSDKATGTVQVESTTPTATPASALPSEPRRPSVNALLAFHREQSRSTIHPSGKFSCNEAPVVISEATSTVTAAASTVEAVTELPEEPTSPEVPNRCLQGRRTCSNKSAVKSAGRTTGQRRKGSREEGRRPAKAGQEAEPAKVPGIQVRCTRHAC